MIRKILAGCALTLALVASRPANAEPPPPPREDLVFVVDPKLGMEGGVRTTRSVGRLLFEYERLLPGDDGAKGGPTFWGAVGRLAKFTFLDGPLMAVEIAFLHEVYGHGARGRELGARPSFRFTLPFPYRQMFSPGDDVSYDAYTEYARGTYGPDERDLPLVLGGLEANYLSAWWINAHVVRNRGVAHHSHFLLYQGKLTYFSSFFSRDLGRRAALDEGNDVDAYVIYLQERFNRPSEEDRASIARKLRTAYAWNLLDPTLFFSLYSLAFDSVGAGCRYAKLPLPEVRGVTFYPTTRFNLTPFGAEHYLDLFLSRRGVLLDVYGRVGSSGLASYTGAGARLLGLPVGRSVHVGGELDVWNQPETLLDARNVYERPNVFGANVGAFLDVRLVGHLGLTGKLAYKSRGYLMGQPLDAGPHGYIGIAWHDLGRTLP